MNKFKYQEEWSGVFGLIQFPKNGNPHSGQMKQAEASGLKFIQSPDVRSLSNSHPKLSFNKTESTNPNAETKATSKPQ